MRYPYRIPFLNTYIDSVTTEEALSQAESFIESGTPHYIVTPNSDIIVQMQDDPELKEICEGADLIMTDGMMLVKISKKVGTPIKERVCMTDFVWDIGRLAEKKGYRLFMLGGKGDTLRKARENYQRKLPALNIVGSYSPPLGFEKSADEYEKALSIIRRANPQVLLVFLGCPKQEKFIARSMKDLNVPLSIPMGGCVDFLAEEARRAPKWMQNAGLEWFFRFIQDPKRLFKRYFIDDIRIFGLAARSRYCKDSLIKKPR